MDTINARIRIARERKGWSQTDLANKLGVKPQAVGQWESGLTMPRNKRLPHIADALDVSHDWLVTGKAEDVNTTLSTQEAALVELFRGLTEEQRGIAVRSLEAQKQQNDKILNELSGIRGKRIA